MNFFLLSTETEIEGGAKGRLCLCGRRPSRARRRPGVGRNGERRMRGFDSSPHLGLGRLVEGDRRHAADSSDVGYGRRCCDLGRERELAGALCGGGG
jgi:hypothetical protein